MKKQKITIAATIVSEHEQVKAKETNQNIFILKKEFAVVPDTKEILNDHEKAPVLNTEPKVDLIQEQDPFILKKNLKLSKTN
ncbi:MAG: hypothetical protein FF85_03085 [alpha proteobacterium QL1]|jgi:hypothetical protein|nr:MAG: hypothetical protein FF85_03085 [alpha proteobacterium QL1]